MPQHACDGGGARSQLRHAACVVKQQASHLPLIQTGAAVSAGDQTRLHVVLFLIEISKAFGKADAGKGAVRIDRDIHLPPVAVAQDKEVFVPDGLYLVGKAPAGHIGLADEKEWIMDRLLSGE